MTVTQQLLRKLLGAYGHHHTGGLDAAPAAGTMPPGTIIAWHGGAESIPAGWRVCDGGGGTPDLRDRFIKGAQDDSTGGATPGSAGGSWSYSLEHSHTVSISLAAGGNHAHSGYVSISESQMHGQQSGNGGSDGAGGQHGHGLTLNYTGDFHGHGVSAGSYNALGGYDNRPPFYGLFYAMRVAVGSQWAAGGGGQPWYDTTTLAGLWRRLWSHTHAESQIGMLPVGAVVNYRYGGGTPAGFADCDGGNGTPDLRGKYLVTAGYSYGLGAEGGVAQHSWYHGHSAYASTGGEGYHGHSVTVGPGDTNNRLNSYNDESYHHTNPQTGHSHDPPSTDGQGGWGHSMSVGLDPVAGAYENQPGFVTVRYLKRIA
jgi:hypothetical protein